MTGVYGVLDPPSGRFTYTNCGHNPPLLIKLDGTYEELDRGGPALGVFDVAEYEEAVVTINPGDSLLLYTDGVIEVANEDGKEFGVKRLVRTLKDSKDLAARKVIRAIMDGTRAFSGTDSYTDDFTVVVIKRDL